MGRASFELWRYEVSHTVEKPTAGFAGLYLRSNFVDMESHYHRFELRFIRGYDGFAGSIHVRTGPSYVGLLVNGFEDFSRIYDVLRRESPLFMSLGYEGDDLALDPYDSDDRRIVTAWTIGSRVEPIGEGDADFDVDP